MSPRRAHRAAAIALGAVLLAGAGLFAAVAARMLAYRHEVVVSEAAISLAVSSVRDGIPLYSARRWTESPFVIVHYTPLYYLVTAAVEESAGPGFVAGRLVSIASTVLTAVVAFLWIRRRTSSTVLGLLAGALWLSFYQVVFWGTAMRVDALAILYECTGLWLYAMARSRGRAGHVALPFFVAAWATKQVMVVGLLAATADCLWRDRRSGVRFLAGGIGAIVALFAFAVAVTEGDFWTATVLATVSAAADTPWVVFLNAELFFGSPWNLLVLVLAAAAAVFARPRTDARFLGLYLGLGLPIAIATDANLPRFFPPLLAMALLVPLLVYRLQHAPRLCSHLLVALAFTGAVHNLYEMRSLVRERVLTLHEGNRRLGLARALRHHTSGTGEVLAQDVGMLRSAELPVTIADPYVFSILAGNAAWHPDLIIAGIREQRYEAVVLNRPIAALDDHEWTTLWIAPARSVLERNYRLAEVVTTAESWRFLEPTRYIYVPAGGIH